MSDDQRVNWVSVINFLEKQYSNISLRQKQWQYQKQILNQKINGLQAELRSNVIVCENLVNRIKILEIALKEEKFKKGQGKKIADEEHLNKLLQKFNLNKQIDKNTESHQDFLRELVKDLNIIEKQPPRIIEQQQESLETTISKAAKDRHFKEIKTVGAHLDVITTAVAFSLNHQPFLATSSEDCLIKIWNHAQLVKQETPQPQHTLRKHTGPLFSLAACPNPYNSSEVYLFSGGIEGDIKSFKTGQGHTDWVKSWLNGVEEEQAIWELQTLENKLLSSSSDGFVRLFKVEGAQSLQLVSVKQYKEKQFNQTAIKWMSSDNLFLAASSSAPRIVLWDVEGRIHNKYLYEVQKGKEGGLSQVNKIQFMPDKKLIVAACEDAFVRLFDLNSGKIIKKLQAKGSVGSVLGWDWDIVAGDQTGCLNFWQARTFRMVEQRERVHLQKYDTGVTCLVRSGDHLLTAGADGLIKMFI